MRSLHASLNRWLWGRAAILAAALVIGWITGSFYTGLTVALIAFAGLFVGAGLIAGSLEWRVGRRFAAPRGRVVTTREVMEEGWPILLVRNEQDAPTGWHFISDEDDLVGTRAISVHIQRMLERDPSIAALADLPPGWQAWRSSEEAFWDRGPIDEAHVK